MTISEILLTGSGGLILLLTMVQIAPIKINPWSAIARALGRALNGDLLRQVSAVQATLDEHIRLDDERYADGRRERILRFNNELIRNIRHEREDFIEILSEIDAYEDYCRNHKEYQNSRAVHAIANIERCYDERLEKHDFST